MFERSLLELIVPLLDGLGNHPGAHEALGEDGIVSRSQLHRLTSLGGDSALAFQEEGELLGLMGELIRVVDEGPATCLGGPHGPVGDAEGLGHLRGNGTLADHVDGVILGVDLGGIPERWGEWEVAGKSHVADVRGACGRGLTW